MSVEMRPIVDLKKSSRSDTVFPCENLMGVNLFKVVFLYSPCLEGSSEKI